MILVLSHLIKNGGSTFVNILRRNFKREYALLAGYNIKNNNLHQNQLEKVLDQHGPLKAISGHSIRPHIDLNFKTEALNVIFLRDPVLRAISAYNHYNSKPENDISFEKYIQLPPTNYQTHWIAGEECIETALETLIENNFFVGIVEEFDASMICLQNMLRKEYNMEFDIRYERSNVRKKKLITKDNLSKQQMNMLEQNLSTDIDLYHKVKATIFKKQLELYGFELEKKINEFRAENKNYTFSRSFLYKEKIIQRIDRYRFNNL